MSRTLLGHAATESRLVLRPTSFVLGTGYAEAKPTRVWSAIITKRERCIIDCHRVDKLRDRWLTVYIVRIRFPVSC